MSLKAGIICACEFELAPYLSSVQDCVVSEKAMLKIYEGTINGVTVAALYSGVCKVNAAIAAQILIDTYHVSLIINSGTAGGMDKKLDLFDTVISTQAAYHDVSEEILTNYHPGLSSVFFHADESLLRIAQQTVKRIQTGHTVYFGRMVTGEQFIEDNLRDEINQRFAPLSVDMETASIAHVCYVNRIPFIAVRTITDTATHSGIGTFEMNCMKASEISKEIVVEFLKDLNREE